jgi:hypothetical protein
MNVSRRFENGVLVEHLIDGIAQSLDQESHSKISNAIAATFRVVKAAVKGEKVHVSSEESDRRLAICQSCEFFTGTTCLKCGCITKFKTKLATEHCPIQKW